MEESCLVVVSYDVGAGVMTKESGDGARWNVMMPVGIDDVL